MQTAPIIPAAVFMAVVPIRQVDPQDYEPTHTAQQAAMRFAWRMWTLWALLAALPVS